MVARRSNVLSGLALVVLGLVLVSSSVRAAQLEAPTLPSYAATPGLTLEAWIKTAPGQPGPGFDPRIIRAVNATEGPCGNLSTQVWQLWICRQSACPQGALYAGLQKDGSCVAEVHSTHTVTDGNWHHVACVFDGTTLTVFVDGQPDGSVPAAGQNADVSGGHVTIGNSTDHNNAFQGWIDEMRIWNVARTASQVDTYKSAELSPTAGLVGYWKFNGGPNDASGNANDLTPSPTGIGYGTGVVGSGAVQITNTGGSGSGGGGATSPLPLVFPSSEPPVDDRFLKRPPAWVTFHALDTRGRGGVFAFGSLHIGSTAVLTLHDVAGRRRAVLWDGELVAGAPGTVAWDGRDGNGDRLPAGVYFVRLRAGAHVATATVVLVGS